MTISVLSSSSSESTSIAALAEFGGKGDGVIDGWSLFAVGVTASRNLGAGRMVLGESEVVATNESRIVDVGGAEFDVVNAGFSGVKNLI